MGCTQDGVLELLLIFLGAVINVMWLCRRISLHLEYVEVFNSDVMSAKCSQVIEQ